MSVPRICFSPSITRRTCTPCPVAQFRALMSDPHVQDICDQIKLLDGKDPDEMARLKRQLPIITPHAQRFEDNRRHADTAIPSGLVMLDIDHIRPLSRPSGTLSPSALERYGQGEITTIETENGVVVSISAQQVLELRICFIAITPSGHGLRIIAERRMADLAADQAQLAKDLGFVEFDSCTKDLSRASFIMPISYVLYMDDAAFEFPDEDTANQAANVLSLTPELHSGTSHSEAIPAVSSSAGLASTLPTTYHNLEYTAIMQHLVTLLGGTPEFGERNTFYFTLVRYARYICDFNCDLLLAVLPDFGLGEPERRAVITSAVNRPRKSDIPDLITRALALASTDQQSQGEKTTDWGLSPNGSFLLPELPKPLDVICRHLPVEFRPAMVIAALPILGTLATRVRFRYLDHAVHSFSFMSCITAPAATGKSFIRTPVNLLLTPIDEQDEIERQREQEYKDALRAAKNSKNQPENPRSCPRNNGINISIAKLLQLLSYSDGKHLIGIGEEIDTLVKSERAGVWSQKSDIYRLGFDNAKYGQNYMSDSSFSANVPVFYNLLLTGTPGGMYRFFKDVEDGLVTRFCFAQLPDMFGCEIPDFAAYTEAEEQEVIRYARFLDEADGTITCPAVDEAIRGWLEEKRQLAISSDSRAIDTLRRRSAVIGFRAGYLAHILESADSNQSLALSASDLGWRNALNGRSEETGCPEGGKGASAAFALWVAEYVFRNQMQLFGSQFEKVADEYLASQNTRGRVRKLLQSLPDTFTKADLMALRARNGQTTDVAYVLSRWRQNGLITDIGPNTFRKL